MALIRIARNWATTQVQFGDDVKFGPKETTLRGLKVEPSSVLFKSADALATELMARRGRNKSKHNLLRELMVSSSGLIK